MPVMTTVEKTAYDNMLKPREKYQLEGPNPHMKLIVKPGGHSAQMQVVYGTRAVATMEWLEATQEFVFSLMDKDSGVSKADFEIKHDGHAYIGGQEIATLKTIREFRTTVEHNITNHAKPSIADCKVTFKLLPHFDWKKDDDYYVKDTTGGKLVLIKYRATPAATEAAPGNFFYEVLTKAV